MRILIAPDKFKGSLSGQQAAAAIQQGFEKIFPNAEFDLLPLADGGEGILDAFQSALGGELVSAKVHDALARPVDAEFLFLEIDSTPTAVIESSQANGLWRIASNERDLLRASTFGVGQLIEAAIKNGAKNLTIGIGGSATNDAGIGLAAALGYRFLDSNGAKLEAIPANIIAIHRIIPPEHILLPPITVACDVANPLLGPRGATRVYGPQKGLLPDQTDAFESAHRHLVELTNSPFAEHPGAGAAGGLGFGLLTFCNAELRSGFDCIAAAVGLEARLAKADLVITAEGSLDSQTLEGKTPHGVSKLARKHGLPVYALAGCLADEEILRPHFDGIAAIVNRPMSLDEAMENAVKLLENAAARMAHIIRP